MSFFFTRTPQTDEEKIEKKLARMGFHAAADLNNKAKADVAAQGLNLLGFVSEGNVAPLTTFYRNRQRDVLTLTRSKETPRDLKTATIQFPTGNTVNIKTLLSL